MSTPVKLASALSPATARMPARSTESGGQKTLSSFFKPVTQGPKRPARDDVLILDSDDDDEHTESGNARKRVKTEHDTRSTQLSPIASTSRLPAAVPARNGVPAPPSSTRLSPNKESGASTRRIRSFVFDSTANGHAATSQKSEESQRRHEAFVKKLSLGPDLLKKRNSYLQKEHHLEAANREVENQGHTAVAGLAAGDSPSADEDDEVASDDAETSPRGLAKGKGKAPAPADSRLARFVSKSGTKAPSPASQTDTKYTPLEKQVLALRKEHPGVLLVVEVRSQDCSLPHHSRLPESTLSRPQVGYKFRFFDEDARVASRILNIACFPQQHMLTASIPTHRLDVHVKRLLNAGYKVGVVRQQETAACVHRFLVVTGTRADRRSYPQTEEGL